MASLDRPAAAPQLTHDPRASGELAAGPWLAGSASRMLTRSSRRKPRKRGTMAHPTAAMGATSPISEGVASLRLARGVTTGRIELIAPTTVSKGAPFVVTVDVHAVPPGQSITVVIEQKRGTSPLCPPQTTVGAAGPGGVVSVSFTMGLAGPGR